MSTDVIIDDNISDPPPPPIRQSQRLMGSRAQASAMIELDQPAVSGPVNAAAERAIAATRFATAGGRQ